jgi:methionine biosynthesis protein MetW
MSGLIKFQYSTEDDNKIRLLELVDRNPSAKILDLGCGNGDFTRELGRKVGTENIYGTDIVSELMISAKSKGIIVCESDLNTAIPYRDETFNLVCANQVFEHLNNTDLILKEVFRVLKENGVFIISTPNLASWHNIACLLLGWQPFATSLSDEINVGNPLHTTYKMNPAGGLYPVHRRIPTYRGLKELLEFHGFKIEQIIGVGYYPFPRYIAKFLSRFSPKHSVYLTMKVRKERNNRGMVRDGTSFKL